MAIDPMTVARIESAVDGICSRENTPHNFSKYLSSLKSEEQEIAILQGVKVSSYQDRGSILQYILNLPNRLDTLAKTKDKDIIKNLFHTIGDNPVLSNIKFSLDNAYRSNNKKDMERYEKLYANFMMKMISSDLINLYTFKNTMDGFFQYAQTAPQERRSVYKNTIDEMLRYSAEKSITRNIDNILENCFKDKFTYKTKHEDIFDLKKVFVVATEQLSYQALGYKKGSPEKVMEWLEARTKTEKILLINGVKLLAKEGRTDVFGKIMNTYGGDYLKSSILADKKSMMRVTKASILKKDYELLQTLIKADKSILENELKINGKKWVLKDYIANQGLVDILNAVGFSNNISEKAMLDAIAKKNDKFLDYVSNLSPYRLELTTKVLEQLSAYQNPKYLESIVKSCVNESSHYNKVVFKHNEFGKISVEECDFRIRKIRENNAKLSTIPQAAQKDPIKYSYELSKTEGMMEARKYLMYAVKKGDIEQTKEAMKQLNNICGTEVHKEYKQIHKDRIVREYNSYVLAAYQATKNPDIQKAISDIRVVDTHRIMRTEVDFERILDEHSHEVFVNDLIHAPKLKNSKTLSAYAINRIESEKCYLDLETQIKLQNLEKIATDKGYNLYELILAVDHTKELESPAVKRLGLAFIGSFMTLYHKSTLQFNPDTMSIKDIEIKSFVQSLMNNGESVSTNIDSFREMLSQIGADAQLKGRFWHTYYETMYSDPEKYKGYHDHMTSLLNHTENKWSSYQHTMKFPDVVALIVANKDYELLEPYLRMPYEGSRYMYKKLAPIIFASNDPKAIGMFVDKCFESLKLEKEDVNDYTNRAKLLYSIINKADAAGHNLGVQMMLEKYMETFDRLGLQYNDNNKEIYKQIFPAALMVKHTTDVKKTCDFLIDVANKGFGFIDRDMIDPVRAAVKFDRLDVFEYMINSGEYRRSRVSFFNNIDTVAIANFCLKYNRMDLLEKCIALGLFDKSLILNLDKNGMPVRLSDVMYELVNIDKILEGFSMTNKLPESSFIRIIKSGNDADIMKLLNTDPLKLTINNAVLKELAALPDSKYLDTLVTNMISKNPAYRSFEFSHPTLGKITLGDYHKSISKEVDVTQKTFAERVDKPESEVTKTFAEKVGKPESEVAKTFAEKVGKPDVEATKTFTEKVTETEASTNPQRAQ